MAKGLAEYITSYFRKTPQVRQSSRQSIELNVVDANGVPLTPPRANQILHEIETGVYMCPFCHNNFRVDIAEIWHCHRCYYAYHPGCVIPWAMRSAQSRNNCWNCPTCMLEHSSLPLPSCWCRKHNSKTMRIHAGSCGQSCSQKKRCGTRLNCPTYICSAICHPGPCVKNECTDNCGQEIPQDLASPHRTALDDRSNDIREQFLDSIGFPLKNLWSLILFALVFGSFEIFWAVNRVRRFTKPLENQKFTEGNLRTQEQSFCFVAAAALFPIKFSLWGTALRGINRCLRICLGFSASRQLPTPSYISWRKTKVITAKVVFTILGAIFIIFVFCVPAVLFFGPGRYWMVQTSGTCDSFDTRVKLSDPSVDYFGLHNRTTKDTRFPLDYFYTQTPGTYRYASWKDYESYKSGTDLFNITRINNTILHNQKSSSSEPFDQFWRIMGKFGDKPIHMDFDLLHRSWRLKEGIIVIDSEDPSSSFYKGGALFDRLKPGEIYDSNKTAHLIPNFEIAIQNLRDVRNGTWTATDSENMELVLPELDLHIPLWGLFEKHCVYQSLMRVFRKPTEESRKTWSTWSRVSNREEVMRTASFGYGGNDGLEVCVRRREYEWTTDGVTVMEPGLGEDLLVPLGLMAVVRRSMRVEQKKITDACHWPEL